MDQNEARKRFLGDRPRPRPRPPPPLLSQGLDPISLVEVYKKVRKTVISV